MNAPLPKAYRNGFKDFYGRDFLVTPDVLIPRPETEQIIDLLLTLAGKPYLPGMKAPKRVLPERPIIVDVGTGSGCIAITTKLELKDAKVIGVDIEEGALKIAEKNAQKFGADVALIKSNLLENIKEKPDVVIANLPYVDENWSWLDKKTLSAEPSSALYAKDGGLELIKRLIAELAKLKTEHILLESDPCQHRDIIEFAEKNGLHLNETRGFILYFSSNAK